MNLLQFKYLTDENIPPRAVSWLKSKGLDVFDIKSEGLGGTPDEDILPIAEDAKQHVFKIRLRLL